MTGSLRKGPRMAVALEWYGYWSLVWQQDCGRLIALRTSWHHLFWAPFMFVWGSNLTLVLISCRYFTDATAFSSHQLLSIWKRKELWSSRFRFQSCRLASVLLVLHTSSQKRRDFVWYRFHSRPQIFSCLLIADGNPHELNRLGTRMGPFSFFECSTSKYENLKS